MSPFLFETPNDLGIGNQLEQVSPLLLFLEAVLVYQNKVYEKPAKLIDRLSDGPEFSIAHVTLPRKIPYWIDGGRSAGRPLIMGRTLTFLCISLPPWTTVRKLTRDLR